MVYAEPLSPPPPPGENAVAVMDAQMAEDAGQSSPTTDPDFYTVGKSAARTELVPQPPPTEGTLEYQLAKQREAQTSG